MNERLKEFITYLGVSNKDFSDSIGVSRQQLEGWINQNVKVPIHCLQEIAKVYQNLNTRWLLIGDGLMRNDLMYEQAKSHYDDLIEKGNDSVLKHAPNYYDDKFAELHKEIETLQKRYIDLLESVIKERGIK